MKKAFTLIEVMIAMALLVIVTGSTLIIFRASARSWRRGEIRAQRYQSARFILERMTKEISSIVPASLAGPNCMGTADGFYFVCTLKDAPASLVEAGYWLDDETKALMRRYQLTPDYNFSTFEKEEALSENVYALNFQYSTGDNWQEDWDSHPGAAQSGLLPKAVKIEFDIQDEKGSQIEAFSTIVIIASAAE